MSETNNTPAALPVKDANTIAHEKVLRLECLKLANHPDKGAELVAARAAVFSDYVIGE